MSNIGDMLVDAKGLKYVHDSIKNTFSTKQELTNVDSKFSEVNSARQSGSGTTYDNLKARLDADKAESDAEIAALNESLGDVQADLDELSDSIGETPKTQIASVVPTSMYIILDSPQWMRFENGKKYNIKVTISEDVASGIIAVSKTSSASGSFITYENNTVISAGVHIYRFEYTEDMGRSLYLRLYLDSGYTKCTNVSIELIDDTAIRTLINNNTEDINALNAPVEDEITAFVPSAMYSILDSPQLLRFQNGKKYVLRITINEDVTSGTITLSNSSSASGTVYTFVKNSAIAQGEYRYIFEYDSSWTTAGIYLRLALDGGYAKCTQVVLMEVVADNISAYGKLLGNKIETIESDPTKYKYAIDTMLCIGDSLTEGIYDGGQYSPIKQGYPYYIGRMLNIDVTNGGYNGYTAQTWYNDKSNLYTYTDYNFVVIWLGTNGGLTDTLDTDVNPYTDYNDYADTNTGCYCKIIEKIKAENPHCMIILCNCFAGTTKAVTNSVISKIASKYGLIIADMSDMGTNNHPEWHNGTIPVHFGKAGYLISAKRIVDTASAYFEENPIRCEFGLSAFARQ